MFCCPNGVTHIMQAIEYRDKVVASTWELLGLSHLECDSIGEPFFLRIFARGFNGLVVIVKTEESRFWECFGHQNCRRSCTTSHIRDTRSTFQFRLHPVESRNPRRNQIRSIAGPEKLLASVKNAVLMFMPAHSSAGAERLGNARHRGKRSERQFKGARQICGAIFCGERKRL